MTWRIVVVEKPILGTPQVGSFSTNILTQAPQDVTVEFLVHGLTLRYEFSVNNASRVKEDDEHAFDGAGALPSLLWSW